MDQHDDDDDDTTSNTGTDSELHTMLVFMLQLCIYSRI